MNGVIADKTVSQWLTVDQRGSEMWKFVRGMLGRAELEELEAGSFSYDLKGDLERVGELGMRGLFVAGSEDGVLPEEMKEAVEGLMGVGFVEVRRAKRLVMVERVEEFVGVVGGFLESNL
jgi:hypothetical protein